MYTYKVLPRILVIGETMHWSLGHVGDLKALMAMVLMWVMMMMMMMMLVMMMKMMMMMTTTIMMMMIMMGVAYVQCDLVGVYTS